MANIEIGPYDGMLQGRPIELGLEWTSASTLSSFYRDEPGQLWLLRTTGVLVAELSTAGLRLAAT